MKGLDYMLLTSIIGSFGLAQPAQTNTATNTLTAPRYEDLFRMRLGLFVHWAGPAPNRTRGKQNSDGSRLTDIDSYADSINITRVAQEIESLGFEYVALTDFHGWGTMLHPSAASDRWRGPGYASKRDVVGELISELRKRGISLLLFTHPLDGHDFSVQQRMRLGWDDPTDHYKKWNDFINDVYAELTERYGKVVTAIGFDSEFGQSGSAEWKDKLDLLRLRKTILSRAPNLALFALAGPNDTCEFGLKEVFDPSWHDPWKSRPENDWNSETWPCYRRFAAIVQGRHWATITGPEGGMARLNGDQLFRYTVLQAGAATEGPGVAWAVSPYPDGTWENNAREAFARMQEHIAPIAESLRSVYSSASWPTLEGTTLSILPHGIVATRKTDDTVEYVHVLNPPKGRTLALPSPVDGKKFISASILRNGHSVRLRQDESTVHLTLDETDQWESLDTVLKLTVAVDHFQPRNLALHKRVFASSSDEGALDRRANFGRIRLVDGERTVLPKPKPWSTGNSGWSSLSGPADREEWVAVDLGETMPVATVVLYPCNEGAGFPTDYELQLSLDTKCWETVTVRTDTAPPVKPIIISFPSKKARYIRFAGRRLRPNLNAQEDSRMQLVEMEVRGPGN